MCGRTKLFYTFTEDNNDFTLYAHYPWASAEMFPQDGYQKRLEAYLARRSITDAAVLETYIKEFDYNSHKENFKWSPMF